MIRAFKNAKKIKMKYYVIVNHTYIPANYVSISFSHGGGVPIMDIIITVNYNLFKTQKNVLRQV